MQVKASTISVKLRQWDPSREAYQTFISGMHSRHNVIEAWSIIECYIMGTRLNRLREFKLTLLRGSEPEFHFL